MSMLITQTEDVEDLLFSSSSHILTVETYINNAETWTGLFISLPCLSISAYIIQQHKFIYPKQNAG